MALNIVKPGDFEDLKFKFFSDSSKITKTEEPLDKCVDMAISILESVTPKSKMSATLNEMFSSYLCRRFASRVDNIEDRVMPGYLTCNEKIKRLINSHIDDENSVFKRMEQMPEQEMSANSGQDFDQVFCVLCCFEGANYIGKVLFKDKQASLRKLADKNEGLEYFFKLDRVSFPREMMLIFKDTDSLTSTLKSLLYVINYVENETGENYDAVISDTVSDVMKIFNTLYSDCFIERPVGVLTSEGIMTLKEKQPTETIDSTEQVQGYIKCEAKADVSTAFYAQHYYENVQKHLKLGEKSYLGAIPENADDFLKHQSYPLFHLYNVMGMNNGKNYNSWMDFQRILNGYVRTIIAKLFDSYTGSDYITFKMQVVHRLTTIVIVNEFKVNGMMSFTYHNTNSGGEPEFGELVLSKMSSIIGKSTGQLIAEPNLGNDCYKFLYVGDGDAYNKEILFAYKAYENMIASGTPVNSKNIILGKRLSNGMPYTVNLQSPQEIFTSILAGSGSGKGVLTLSILAGLFAAGHSVGYVDYKPDMSAMLWDMERKIGRSDCKLLAIDGLAGIDKRGSRPVRQYPYGYQGEVFNENLMLYQKLHLMPYLKTLQMSCVLAGLRARGVQDFGSKKIFFIMDEAQQANTAYADIVNELYKFKIPKAKAGEELELTPYQKAMERMKQVFVDDIFSAITDVGNTTGRVGQVGYLFIGQATDPAAWKSRSGDWKYNLFGFPIGKTSLKLMGKGINEGSMYGLPKKPYPGKEMMKQLGYWTISKMSASGNDTAPECIKSYLVLNENDYDPSNPNNGGYASSLLANISDSTTQEHVIRDELTMGDGHTIRESVGFYGLMKMLCPDEDKLVKTMSSLYNYIEQILTASGILKHLGYSSVEEYLYSANPESFFTVKEIIDAYKSKGATIKKNDSVVGDVIIDESANSYSGFGVSTPDLDKSSENSTRKMSDPFPPPSDYKANSDHKSTSDYKSDTAPKTKSNDRWYSDFSDTVYATETRSANRETRFSNAYTEPMDIKPSPFIGAYEPFTFANAFRDISRLLLKEIRKVYGGLDRIRTIDIANSGLIVINDIKFMPQFDNEFISSLPIDIRRDVAQGNIAELFYFRHLYKFPNLWHLSIESTRLAETRVRKDLRINRNGWSVLFARFSNLKELIIAGNVIHNSEEADDYETNDRAGFGLKEKLMGKFNICAFNEYWINKATNFGRKARHVTFTAAKCYAFTQVAIALSPIIGPWGLFFGTLWAVNKYKQHKNDYNENNSKQTDKKKSGKTK